MSHKTDKEGVKQKMNVAAPFLSKIYTEKEQITQRSEPGEGGEAVDAYEAHIGSGAQDYADILYMEYPPAGRKERISSGDRAAQFAPFAALAGYEEVIREEGRITRSMRILSEDERERLDRQLSHVTGRVQITYFIPDEKREGGAYEVVCGVIKQINRNTRTVIMEDRTVIPVDRISDIREEPLLSADQNLDL